MPHRRTYGRGANAHNANVTPLVPDQEVLNAEFWNSIQVDCDKLREHAKENKKARTENYDYSQQKSGGGNRSQFQQRPSTPAPSSTSVPSSKF
uniref:Gag-pol polyprotein n=1 Tax=Solanum tuberosum TaxID=4113 RepID=M1DUK7_SOLTU